MNNVEVRRKIFEKDIKKYQVAEKLGINWVTLSRWLQTEMSDDKKARVLAAIDELTQQGVS